MEKSYYFATIFFGWIITLAIAGFTIVAFKMGYVVTGFLFLLITIASVFMNVLFIRKWFRSQPHL
ncbi:hypothetical protein ACQKP0_05240 [Heyndrickxia sp. NPDC080065]|uniref:hypothetical protein n=1 Tax=Heyndrickxia sp. NPDC080065 TaxID=3390568 RepID=UPI003D043734